LQTDALARFGCHVIFSDEGQSGARRTRPGLERCLAHLGVGDDLVVWKLDRLGRSLPHLIEVVSELEQRRIGLVSLSESINTASPGGVLVFHIMAALAQFERALISERTKAGMLSARLRGRHVGRPRKLDDDLVAAAMADSNGKPGGIADAALRTLLSASEVSLASAAFSSSRFCCSAAAQSVNGGCRTPPRALHAEPI
jgi:DNA invertase Pin-like site-specific DNA recombinase